MRGAMRQATVPPNNEQDRFRGCLLGLAAGDAVGTTLEFRSRDTIVPIDDMVGGGPFRLKPGEWTDDTSMALCLATSLVESRGFDPADQMARYCKWRDFGYLSSNGRCFDLGVTVGAALDRYRETNDPIAGSIDPRSAGNGSIMRLAPVVMFYANDAVAAVDYAAKSSLTTHGADECLDACRILAELILRALDGQPKEEVLRPVDLDCCTPKLQAVADLSFLEKSADEIRGTGYVVESLEAAIWCFSQTDTFRDAILMAANLGDDADTTAAICGQIAGAHYGMSGIPESWRERLAMSAEIIDLADRLRSTPSRDGVRIA